MVSGGKHYDEIEKTLNRVVRDLTLRSGQIDSYAEDQDDYRSRLAQHAFTVTEAVRERGLSAPHALNTVKRAIWNQAHDIRRRRRCCLSMLYSNPETDSAVDVDAIPVESDFEARMDARRLVASLFASLSQDELILIGLLYQFDGEAKNAFRVLLQDTMRYCSFKRRVRKVRAKVQRIMNSVKIK